MIALAPPAWCREYVGIPFAPKGRTRDGADCWGLVRIVLRERFGCDPPDIDNYNDPKDAAVIDALVSEHKAKGQWQAIAPGKEQSGDVVVVRLGGRLAHVGVVVSLGFFLHVEEHTDACIVNYHSPRWRNRVDGFYRWVPC